ncbi:uncharacterized protein [Clinocottus analis]|uniref:uncharacterized protein n=1 Tax=Clinocottus analis TaxID=304258 RepID=UPI0035C20DF8
MEKDSAKPTNSRGSSDLNRGQEQLRSASEEAIIIRGSKTSQDNRALEMTELLESELVHNLSSGGVKRKASEEAIIIRGSKTSQDNRALETTELLESELVHKLSSGGVKRKASEEAIIIRGSKTSQDNRALETTELLESELVHNLSLGGVKRKASEEAIIIRGSKTSQDNRALETTELLESELVHNLSSGGVKRKASEEAIIIRGSKTSQDNRAALETTELLESELVHNLSSGGVKRKATEGAPDAKRRRLSSTDTESCNSKKKASTNVKQKECKKIKLAMKDNKPKTQQEPSIDALRAKFEAKYEQQHELGRGGCGCVFAGFRREDNLPVAIKCIPVDNILKQTDNVGRNLSIEVAVMLRLQDETSEPVRAPVLLLDWYDLDQELILVHERPVPSKDLHCYVQDNGGSLPEEEAKIILKQLVDAAIELQDHCIFHRDIKLENILIETGSEVPRVRLIDFGLSCFIKKRRSFRNFYGTSPHCPPEWSSRGKYSAGPTTVWQMGIVLFEMLHNFVMFKTTNFLNETLTISDMLSKECQELLQACLMEDPDLRPTLKQIRQHSWLN